MVEIIVSVALLAIVLTSLYAGMTMSFAITQAARQNLRATQIMVERMEGIRLYNWNQLVYSNMVPATFTNYYYPLATENESKGITYYGEMWITNAVLSPSATYSTNMRAIVVTVSWTNYNGHQGIPNSRTMTTYASDTGIQNYVYSN